MVWKTSNRQSSLLESKNDLLVDALKVSVSLLALNLFEYHTASTYMKRKPGAVIYLCKEGVARDNNAAYARLQ
jgi:hypothetical protein